MHRVQATQNRGMEDIRAAAYQRILTHDIVGINLDENDTTLYHDAAIQKTLSKSKNFEKKGSSVVSHYSTVVEATKTLGVERDVKILALANVFRLLYQKAKDNSAEVPLWWNWNETSMTMRIALSRMQDWAKSARPMDVIQLMRYAMVSYYLLADEGKRDEEKELLDVQVPSVVVNDNKKFYWRLSDTLRKFRDDFIPTTFESQTDYYYQDEVIDVNGIEVRQQLGLQPSASNEEVMNKSFKLKFTETTPKDSEIANYDRITIEWTRKEKQSSKTDLGTNDIFVYVSNGKAKVMPFLEYLTKKKVFQETFLDEKNLEENWKTFKKKWNQKAKDTKDDKRTRIEREELKLKQLEDNYRNIQLEISDFVGYDPLIETQKQTIDDAINRLEDEKKDLESKLEEAEKTDKNNDQKLTTDINAKKGRMEKLREDLKKKDDEIQKQIRILEKNTKTLTDAEEKEKKLLETKAKINEGNKEYYNEKKLDKDIKKNKTVIKQAKQNVTSIQSDKIKEEKEKKEELEKTIESLRSEIATLETKRTNGNKEQLEDNLKEKEKSIEGLRGRLSTLQNKKIENELKALSQQGSTLNGPKKAILDQRILLLKLKSGVGDAAQGKQPRSEHVRRRRAWILDRLNALLEKKRLLEEKNLKGSIKKEYKPGLFEKKYDAARNKNPFKDIKRLRILLHEAPSRTGLLHWSCSEGDYSVTQKLVDGMIEYLKHGKEIRTQGPVQTHYGEVAYTDFFEKLNKGIETIETEEGANEMQKVRDAQGKDDDTDLDDDFYSDSDEDESDDDDDGDNAIQVGTGTSAPATTTATTTTTATAATATATNTATTTTATAATNTTSTDESTCKKIEQLEKQVKQLLETQKKEKKEREQKIKDLEQQVESNSENTVLKEQIQKLQDEQKKTNNQLTEQIEKFQKTKTSLEAQLAAQEEAKKAQEEASQKVQEEAPTASPTAVPSPVAAQPPQTQTPSPAPTRTPSPTSQATVQQTAQQTDYKVGDTVLYEEKEYEITKMEESNGQTTVYMREVRGGVFAQKTTLLSNLQKNGKKVDGVQPVTRRAPPRAKEEAEQTVTSTDKNFLSWVQIENKKIAAEQAARIQKAEEEAARLARIAAEQKAARIAAEQEAATAERKAKEEEEKKINIAIANTKTIYCYARARDDKGNKIDDKRKLYRVEIVDYNGKFRYVEANIKGEYGKNRNEINDIDGHRLFFQTSEEIIEKSEEGELDGTTHKFEFLLGNSVLDGTSLQRLKARKNMFNKDDQNKLDSLAPLFGYINENDDDMGNLFGRNMQPTVLNPFLFENILYEDNEYKIARKWMTGGKVWVRLERDDRSVTLEVSKLRQAEKKRQLQKKLDRSKKALEKERKREEVLQETELQKLIVDTFGESSSDEDDEVKNELEDIERVAAARKEAKDLAKQRKKALEQYKKDRKAPNRISALKKKFDFLDTVVKTVDPKKTVEQTEAFKKGTSGSNDPFIQKVKKEVEQTGDLIDGIEETFNNLTTEERGQKTDDDEVKCGQYEMEDENKPMKLFNEIEWVAEKDSKYKHTVDQINNMKTKLRKLGWKDSAIFAKAKATAQKQYKEAKGKFTARKTLWKNMSTKDKNIVCNWLEDWQQDNALAIDAIHNRVKDGVWYLAYEGEALVGAVMIEVNEKTEQDHIKDYQEELDMIRLENGEEPFSTEEKEEKMQTFKEFVKKEIKEKNIFLGKQAWMFNLVQTAERFKGSRRGVGTFLVNQLFEDENGVPFLTSGGTLMLTSSEVGLEFYMKTLLRYDLNGKMFIVNFKDYESRKPSRSLKDRLAGILVDSENINLYGNVPSLNGPSKDTEILILDENSVISTLREIESLKIGNELQFGEEETLAPYNPNSTDWVKLEEGRKIKVGDIVVMQYDIDGKGKIEQYYGFIYKLGKHIIGVQFDDKNTHESIVDYEDVKEISFTENFKEDLVAIQKEIKEDRITEEIEEGEEDSEEEEIEEELEDSDEEDSEEDEVNLEEELKETYLDAESFGVQQVIEEMNKYKNATNKQIKERQLQRLLQINDKDDIKAGMNRVWLYGVLKYSNKDDLKRDEKYNSAYKTLTEQFIKDWTGQPWTKELENKLYETYNLKWQATKTPVEVVSDIQERFVEKGDDLGNLNKDMQNNQQDDDAIWFNRMTLEEQLILVSKPLEITEKIRTSREQFVYLSQTDDPKIDYVTLFLDKEVDRKRRVINRIKVIQKTGTKRDLKKLENIKDLMEKNREGVETIKKDDNVLIKAIEQIEGINDLVEKLKNPTPLDAEYDSASDEDEDGDTFSAIAKQENELIKLIAALSEWAPVITLPEDTTGLENQLKSKRDRAKNRNIKLYWEEQLEQLNSILTAHKTIATETMKRINEKETTSKIPRNKEGSLMYDADFYYSVALEVLESKIGDWDNKNKLLYVPSEKIGPIKLDGQDISDDNDLDSGSGEDSDENDETKTEQRKPPTRRKKTNQKTNQKTSQYDILETLSEKYFKGTITDADIRKLANSCKFATRQQDPSELVSKLVNDDDDIAKRFKEKFGLQPFRNKGNRGEKEKSVLLPVNYAGEMAETSNNLVVYLQDPKNQTIPNLKTLTVKKANATKDLIIKNEDAYYRINYDNKTETHKYYTVRIGNQRARARAVNDADLQKFDSLQDVDVLAVDQNAALVAALSTDDNELCLQPIGDYLLVNNVLEQTVNNRNQKIQLPFDVSESFTAKGKTCDGTGDQKQTYNLLGVVQHIGKTAGSGHYIAFVKRGDTWWKCDDKNDPNVTRSSFDELRAAMLFVYPPKMLLYGKGGAGTVSGKPKGIENKANFCYSIALLQLLFSVPNLLKINE